MTPFVCKVTGAKANASPVDFDYAIPPRRCLNPENCFFGPRNPMYWLGDQRNMPENTIQSPHFSIRYGFREGAQHDIFKNTNPRRHVTKTVPQERRCNGKRSRLLDNKSGSAFDLTSPNCRCEAFVKNGEVRIEDTKNGRRTWTYSGTRFGPNTAVDKASFMAGPKYFPMSKGPYRLDLSNECYLYVTDSAGLVVWESLFSSGTRKAYIVDSFSGFDKDPSVWPKVKVFGGGGGGCDGESMKDTKKACGSSGCKALVGNFDDYKTCTTHDPLFHTQNACRDDTVLATKPRATSQRSVPSFLQRFDPRLRAGLEQVLQSPRTFMQGGLGGEG